MRPRILTDIAYVNWVQSNTEKFRLIPQTDYEARVRHQPAQLVGLVEGLVDMIEARAAGDQFSLDDVMRWFDVAHPTAYLMTQQGAAKVFIYYLPRLRQFKIVEKL